MERDGESTDAFVRGSVWKEKRRECWRAAAEGEEEERGRSEREKKEKETTRSGNGNIVGSDTSQKEELIKMEEEAEKKATANEGKNILDDV